RQVVLSEAGSYLVTATADVLQELMEWDEINNIATDMINVEAPPIADLVVDTLTHTPEKPFLGDLVSIKAVVKNMGWLEATSSTLSLLVDSDLIDYPVPPLAPGAVFEIQQDEIYTTPGVYMAMAIADADDVVVEFSEDNNVKEDSFFVKKPGPDLEVTSIAHDLMNPTVHDMVTITAIVENTGNVAITSPTVATIQGENELNPHEFAIPALAPGETAQIEALINFHDPGTFVVTATADAGNLIEESYEDNNTAEETVTVILPILPDLVITGVTPSEDNPDTSETFTITVEVKNIGLLDAGSTSTLSILAGDELTPAYYEIPSLDIGTTFTVQRTLIFMENISYLITATADVDDLIFEIYEDNNTTTSDVFIGSIFARLKDYLLGRVELTTGEKKAADANKDGKIDMADLVYLMITGRV
ncbi:hypothetical protein JW926_13950, partial [Candidatus Sumerlaeota bacterium]|nr:hypothetical protein [Candidatus Sumerlaeota bacterium]